MKPLKILFFLMLALPISLLSQSDAAEQLVDEGIELHDLGDYAAALAKYEAALEMENGNFFRASAEKATTLFFTRDFENCVDICESLIKTFSKREDLGQVYTTLGNALDLMEKPREAIDAYERGIARFPEYYMLYYNLGVTYMGVGENLKGKNALIDGIKSYSMHPGSHFALGLTLLDEGKRTLALFAFLRFLSLEVGTERSAKVYELMVMLLEGNAEKTGRNKVSITVDGSAMKEEGAPDNYFPVDFLLDSHAALKYDKKYKKKTKGLNEVEERTLLVKDLISSAGKFQDEGSIKGPLTDLYLPFFRNLEAAGHLEALMYVAHVDGGSKVVEEWLEGNFDQVKALLDWIFEKE